MIIIFPTSENKGLQAKIVSDFENAKFYTLVRINKKGAVLSIKSIPSEELDSIEPYAIVSASPINNPKYSNSNIFVDPAFSIVDKALVKVLREKLFNKAS